MTTTNDGATYSPSPSRRGSTGTWIERERSVRRYLSALESAKPGRDPSRAGEAITRRIHKVDELMVSADPLTRLQLVQERVELHAERLRITNGRQPGLPELEREFVRSARAYGERMGVTYAAWRQMGIDADVLERARIGRSSKRTGSSPPNRATPADRSPATPDEAEPVAPAPPESNGAQAPAPVPEPVPVPEAGPGPTQLERPPAASMAEGSTDPGVNGARASSVAAWLAESGDVEPVVEP